MASSTIKSGVKYVDTIKRISNSDSGAYYITVLTSSEVSALINGKIPISATLIDWHALPQAPMALFINPDNSISLMFPKASTFDGIVSIRIVYM